MRTYSLLALLFIICMACQNSDQEATSETPPEATPEIKFDEAKWKTKEGRDYPYRDSMLNDLISMDALRAMVKEEILDLLGEPDRIDNNHFFYLIKQKRLWFWPLNTKTMVIKLEEDGTPEWIKIHE